MTKTNTNKMQMQTKWVQKVIKQWVFNLTCKKFCIQSVLFALKTHIFLQTIAFVPDIVVFFCFDFKTCFFKMQCTLQWTQKCHLHKCYFPCHHQQLLVCFLFGLWDLCKSVKIHFFIPANFQEIGSNISKHNF